MNGEAEVVAVAHKVASAFDGCALFDVFENLRIAGFEAYDQQTTAGFAHGLQRFAIGGDARGAGPGKAQWLELGAKLDGAPLLDVEGVVVEEVFLHVREELFRVRHLGGNVIGGALAPCVPLRVCGQRQKVHCAGQPRVE